MARKKLQKFFALLLTFSMSMSLLSVGAFAAENDGGEKTQLSSVTLPDGSPAEINVAFGTSEEDLKLPDHVLGTVVKQEEEPPVEVLPSPEVPAVEGEGDVVPTPDGSGDVIQTPDSSDGAAQTPDSSDGAAQTPDSSDGAAQNSGVDEGTMVALDTKADPAPEENGETEETVKIPVRWDCDDYDGWTAGSYTFTADLGDYEYHNSSEFSLTVTVEEQAAMVARINDAEYPTFDAAVKAAADGDTIVLLGNCTTNGLNLSKDLTVTSEERHTYTLNFVEYGIALWGKALRFENCNILMNGIGSTPYTAEWNWMSICASKDASLTLDHVTMTMDAEGTTNSPHAIYFCKNNQLNLTDSTLVIRNYPQDALEWDGGDGGYNVNITDSKFISDKNRSGFTGTFYATIKHSDVQVINSRGNGSNGSHFIIEDSTVNFSNNGGHGLSAGNLSITRSKVTANGNGYIGIAVNNALTITDNSTVTVTDNAAKAYGYAGMRLYNDYVSTVDATSKLYIKDNHNTGLYVRKGTLTVEEGATLEITGNSVSNTKLDGYGGGVYVGYGNNYDPTVILPSNAVICNNHATAGGDDLYVSEGVNGPSLTFCTVGSDWVLKDCDHAIDGWYDDSPNARWSAHEKPLHAVEFTDFDRGSTTVSGPTYLKAAHGLMPVEPDDPTLPDWEFSKSKTATNLDGNYKSQVTLSLPAAQETLESDVVFVLDKSTSANVEKQMISMLNDLNEQAKATGAAINVGVVIFNKVANNVLNLTELNDANLPAIEAAIAQEISGGTNLNAGLLAGKAMLDADTKVDANRKYLVLVSDGSTYYYCKGEDYETAYTISSRNGGNTGEGGQNEQPNDGLSAWDCKYTQDHVPTWETYFGQVENWLKTDYSKYEYTLDDSKRPSTSDLDSEGSIPYAQRNNYPINVDISLYNSYQLYRSMQASGYHCYAVSAETTSSYKFGPSYKNYLRQGENVSFDDIQNDIYYLLDAGSKVVDVIGYGTDNKGNKYNFDFVDDISALTLTVNGKKLPAQEIDVTDAFFTGSYETACYVFGDPSGDSSGYPFALHYYANGEDGQSDECFVWEINVPVSNFAPVQLTYSVKLTDPQTADGTYGRFDADGSEHFDSLLTNLNAALYPVDSNGDQGMPEYFAKPTVSYTNTTPDGGGGGGGGRDDDDGGTKIPDENPPTTDVPGTDIPDENPPTTDVPATDLEDPDVPLADVPKTGDVSALWLALSALSGTGLAGVTFLGRKKRDEE